MIRRILAWAVITGGTVAVVAAVALYSVADTPWGHERVRRLALHALNGATHGTVKIGGLHGDLLRGVVLADVSITDSSGAPFVSARRAEVHYSIADLLHKHLDFHDVVLDHPVVVLTQSAAGSWNYARVFPSSGAPSDTSQGGFGSWIAMTNVRVLDGDVTVRMPWRPDSTLTGAARDSAIGAAQGPASRMIVVAGPDGYEKTIAVHAVTTRVDSLRLADPDHPVKRAQFASLSADVALFRPPDAIVQDLTGTLYLDGDSLWMPHATVVMPASRISARVSYMSASACPKNGIWAPT